MDVMMGLTIEEDEFSSSFSSDDSGKNILSVIDHGVGELLCAACVVFAASVVSIFVCISLVVVLS